MPYARDVYRKTEKSLNDNREERKWIGIHRKEQVRKHKAKKEQFLETAYRRTGEIEELLNHLFYLSKMETGNLPVHAELVDLFVFAEGFAKEQDAQITVCREGDMTCAMADAIHLHLILCRIFETGFCKDEQKGGVKTDAERIQKKDTDCRG